MESFLNLSNQFRAKKPTFENLSSRDCLKKYVGPIISNRADVILVSSNRSTNWQPPELLIANFPVEFSEYSSEDYGAGAWMCKIEDANDMNYCDLQRAASSYRSDAFEDQDVQYCLSQRAEEHCKLQFSAIIMVIVVVCNLIKLGCMGYVAWRQDPEPLITLGDAVESFLAREDTTTRGVCLAGEAYFRHERRIRQLRKVLSSKRTPVARKTCLELDDDWLPSRSLQSWTSVQRRRFATASVPRWSFCIGLSVFPQTKL